MDISYEVSPQSALLTGDVKQNQPDPIKLSRARTVLLLLVCGTAYIVWGALISLQPPFYPTEAELKGATPSQYGFVFGITNLAALLSAPLFGAYGSKLGAKYIYNFGAFVQALCAISFGFLIYVDNLVAFLGLSYFLRALDGIADAAAFGSMVSLLMVLYPEKVSMILASTESVFGVGYTLGPAIGSALYSLGGFGVPFWTVGSVGLLCAILIFFLLPSVKPKSTDSSDGINKRHLTIKAVFSSAQILLPLFDNFVIVNGSGILESMLEPHMKNFAGANQSEVGLAFLLLGGSYLLTSLIAGFICDRIKYPTVVSLMGLMSMAVAYLFIGPVTFIDMPLTVPVIYGMTTLAGIGLGFVMVSSFTRSHAAVLSLGFKDDFQTYLLMSGMWTSSFYLGNFVGPTFGGVLVDYYGFRTTSVVMFSACCLSVIIDTVELSLKICPQKKIGYEQFR